MRRRRVAMLPVRRDEWEAHEQVVLKGLNAEEVGYINDLSRGGNMIGTTQQLTLVFAIASWTLTGEDGMGVPWPPLERSAGGDIELRSIQARRKALCDALMQEDINFLMRKATEVNAPNSKEEQEAFLASITASATAQASQPTAPSSASSESAT